MTRPLTQRPPDLVTDQWIDSFRNVFLHDESGVRVLAFLSARWGFFDRSLGTEEKRVQRQCFMELLICCGVFENDTGEQLVRLLLGTPETKPRVNRVWQWLRSWQRVRTKRLDQAVQNTERTTQ